MLLAGISMASFDPRLKISGMTVSGRFSALNIYLNLSFVDDAVWANISKEDGILCHGESEAVLFCEVTFPNVFFAVIAMYI